MQFRKRDIQGLADVRGKRIQYRLGFGDSDVKSVWQEPLDQMCVIQNVNKSLSDGASN